MRTVLFVLWFAAVLPAPAAIIYSGLQNTAIPMTLDGVYVNVVTNATSTTEPGTWATAPWINPFFGGTLVASNDQLRPAVILGTAGNEQIINQASGSFIDATLDYTADYNGSDSHIGAAANQFHIGAPGLIGFTFNLSSNTHYGWLRMTANNSGAGALLDWAYNDTPDQGILAGLQLAAPEPGCATLLLPGLAALLLRRQRKNKIAA